MIEPAQIILVGVAVLLGCVLQGAVGFAFGMFAIPIMVWSGVGLPDAIAITTGVVLVQTAYSCWQYRDEVIWREQVPLFVLRTISVPFGVWLLSLLVEVGRDRIKQVIGLVLASAVIAQWALRIKPRHRVAPGWTAAAGLTSGVMAGMVGMGAPPVVLWLMAHDWSSVRARSFLWASFLLLMPVLLVVLIWRFGYPALVAFAIGLAFTPVAVIGTHVGHRLGTKLNRRQLRVAAFLVLLALAISSIVGPMIPMGPLI